MNLKCVFYCRTRIHSQAIIKIDVNDYASKSVINNKPMGRCVTSLNHRLQVHHFTYKKSLQVPLHRQDDLFYGSSRRWQSQSKVLLIMLRTQYENK